jgi:hypothetical protein
MRIQIRNLFDLDPGWTNSDPGLTFRVHNTVILLWRCGKDDFFLKPEDLVEGTGRSTLIK